MPDDAVPTGWNILPPATVPVAERLAHVRACSDFAAGLLDRFPDWREGLDGPLALGPGALEPLVAELGLDAGLPNGREGLWRHH